MRRIDVVYEGYDGYDGGETQVLLSQEGADTKFVITFSIQK